MSLFYNTKVPVFRISCSQYGGESFKGKHAGRKSFEIVRCFSFVLNAHAINIFATKGSFKRKHSGVEKLDQSMN